MENRKVISLAALVILAIIYYKRQKTSNIGEKMMFGGLIAFFGYNVIMYDFNKFFSKI